MNCIKVKRNNLLNSIYNSVSPDFRFKETPYVNFFTDPELSSSLYIVLKDAHLSKHASENEKKRGDTITFKHDYQSLHFLLKCIYKNIRFYVQKNETKRKLRNSLRPFNFKNDISNITSV